MLHHCCVCPDNPPSQNLAMQLGGREVAHNRYVLGIFSYLSFLNPKLRDTQRRDTDGCTMPGAQLRHSIHASGPSIRITGYSRLEGIFNDKTAMSKIKKYI